MKKSWATGGDCFIGVLSSREKSQSNGLHFPSAWVHTESGLAYDEHKPYLAFVENGTSVDALYRYLDADHIIKFDPMNPGNSLRNAHMQMRRFREECIQYRSKQSLESVIDFAKTTCMVLVLQQLFTT